MYRVHLNWPIVLINIGEAYRRMGYLSHSLAILDKLIELNTGFYYAYFIRALVYYEMGDLDRAKEDFDIIEKNAASDYPWIHFYREKMQI